MADCGTSVSIIKCESIYLLLVYPCFYSFIHPASFNLSSIHPPIYLPTIYLSTHLSIHPSIQSSIHHLSTNLSTYHQSFYPSIYHPFIHPSINPPNIHPSTINPQCIHPSTHLTTHHLPIHPSTQRLMYPSTKSSIHPPIHPPRYPSIHHCSISLWNTAQSLTVLSNLSWWPKGSRKQKPGIFFVFCHFYIRDIKKGNWGKGTAGLSGSFPEPEDLAGSLLRLAGSTTHSLHSSGK